MTKSYDEKREAFQRMLAGRLPKAVKSVELLANLSRKSDYAWTNSELQQMVDQLDDAVDAVMKSFGLDQEEPAPKTMPATEDPVAAFMLGDYAEDVTMVEAPGPGTAIPGRDRSDIRAALRQLQAGDTKRGTEALRKIVSGWVVPDKED